MKVTRLQLAAWFLAPITAVSAMGGGGKTVVYENDFSTRTSSLAIPSPRWHVSKPYRLAKLLNNYSEYGTWSVWGGQDDIQDCWAKAADGNTNYDADFAVTNDVAGGNQYAIFINDGTVKDPAKDHRTSVIHPFYNRISSGCLRMQIDIRAPSEYPTKMNNNIFAAPSFERFVDVDWRWKTLRYPGMFGANIIQASQFDDIKCYSFGGEGNASTYAGNWHGNKLAPGHWYRYVMDFNVGANSFSGTVYDMGTEAPTFDSVGTAWTTFPSRGFYMNMNDEDGPITGLTIRDCGAVSGRGADFDMLKAPGVDNIRCWWRADDTAFTANDLFYENDFTTRRYRTIVAGNSSKSHAYEPTTYENVTNEFSLYTRNPLNGNIASAVLVAASTGKKEPQPYGLDGWRRLNSDGYQNASVTTNTSGGRVLAISGNSWDYNRFNIIAQPLGETIRSGDVKFSFDVRTPNKWHTSGSRYIYGMLAPQSYLDSGTDEPQARYYAVRIGVRGANVNDFKFVNAVGPYTSSAGNTPVYNDGDAAQSNRWYRCVATVHVDSKTVDTEIYDIGEEPVAMDWQPAESAVYSRTGDPWRNSGVTGANVDDISCFAFMVMSAGGEVGGTFNEKGLVYIDNVQVWKRATAEDEWAYIYTNDFSTRRRYGLKRTVTRLLRQIDRMGEDGWTERNNATEVLEVSGGEGVNPAMYADCIGGVGAARTRETPTAEYTWAVQQLGDSVRGGKVEIRADMRPPRTWTTAQNSGKMAGLIFGNDLYYQGNRNLQDQFLNEYQIRFGFKGEGNVTSFGRHMTTKAYYRNSVAAQPFNATINPTHWYRFVVKSGLAGGKYSVALYDLGTEHPTFDTPTPATPVAEVADVEHVFALEAGEGISTMAVSSIGVMHEFPWLVDDPGLLLIDNVRVTHSADGMVILLR